VYLLLALALTVFAVAPLAYPGYLQVHSGFVPAYNLADLGNRAPEPGWTPDIATSFDALRGDGLLPYYLGLPALWLSGSPLAGVKIVFALSLLLGAAGVYVWQRQGLGPGGAALAALVYTYLPYRLAVVYVRGAWGEALFWGLLPWALATGARHRSAAQTPEVLWLALTALAWALLGLSQAGLTVWAFLLLVIWVLWIDRGSQSNPSGPDERRMHPYTSMFAALGGSVSGLALTFIISGVTLHPSSIDFHHHFLFPSQLISPFWGFGASRPGWDDGLALGLGFAALGLAMLTLVLIAAKEKAQPSEPGQTKGYPDPVRLAVLALVLSLLLLPLSAFLWRLTGLQHTLTYPWQLLGLIGLCLSVLAGTSVKLDRRLAALTAYAGLVILTLLASYSYLEPRFTQHAAGAGPLAAWNEHHVMLLDHDLEVEIPPAAAGLSESTIGLLSLSDYGSPRAGDTLRLTLTWQATRPFDRDLKLFVHLLDPSGQVIAQVDPLAGLGAGPERENYFTSQWDPGALIFDDVAIAIPPDAPPGPYRLAFGLYDGETLERLPVVGQEEARVVLEVVSEELRSKK
jgi:hypothetical protein